MQQDSTTFWADIKNYEERLAQNPDSHFFSRLSDVYLKVNLIDDAIYTARKGVEKYPTYMAGQRALAMACYAKGLHAESRQALELVAAALPEDIEVQKVLGKLHVANGDLDAAQKTYRTALEFDPTDDECQDELNALLKSTPDPVEIETPIASFPIESIPIESTPIESTPIEEPSFVEYSSDIMEEDEEIIELLESDIIEEEEVIVKEELEQHHDPLSTATLAELYVQQNFISKAVEIYRSILADDPANSTVRSRISELEAIEAASSIDLASNVCSESYHPTAFQELESLPPTVSAHGEADAVISTLEGWLDNIRRIKACR